MKIALWVAALLAGTLIWAMLVRAASYGLRQPSSLAFRLGEVIGQVATVFLATGVLALVVYAAQKFDRSKRHVAMWTWTVTLLIVELLLTVGELALS